MTNTVEMTGFENLVHHKVMADRDFLSAPKKGRKRAIKIAKGTTADCVAVWANKYGDPVAKLHLADGSTTMVNPKGLVAKSKLDKAAIAKLSKLEGDANAEREAGRKLVGLMADAVEPAGEKMVFLRFGNEGRPVPASVVQSTKAGNKFLVTVPVWLIKSRFAKIAESLLATAKPVNKAK